MRLALPAAVFAALACLLGSACLVQAQERFPSKPIHLLIPFGAGSTDSIARIVGQKYSELLGVPVVLENRPGANGVLASKFVATRAPDGYTIQLCLNSTHGLNTLFMKNVPFDPFKDFTMIGGMVSSPFALVVHPTIPAATMKEVLDYVRRNPQRANVGSGGVGSHPHLAVELLNQTTRLGFVHVPYSGGGPALTAVLSGEPPFLFATIGSVSGHAAAGRIRMIALMGDKRLPHLPDLPAIGETVPGFDIPDALFGVCGPAQMPAPIVARLNDDLGKAISSPEVGARLAAFGMTPAIMNPAAFAARMHADFAVFRRIAAAAGIKPE
jgi:tripartite-type tricarboxylate transporter receptor subunit TctC